MLRIHFNQPRPQRIFSLKEEGEKEALEHFTREQNLPK